MADQHDKSRPRRKQPLSVLLHVLAGVLLAAVLGLRAQAVGSFGDAVLYAASWIILLHIAIGEYVFIRHLHALSRNQQALDMLAFVLLLCALLSIGSAALWCAFFAGVFALAIIKYLLVESRSHIQALRKYAREKVRWESPAVLLFSVLAMLFNRWPANSPAARFTEIGILIAAALFAFWMIGIRHIYQRVAKAAPPAHTRL